METEFTPLTDAQWEAVAPLLPPPPQRRGKGQPHAAWRGVVNAILYVLIRRDKWENIPHTQEFASKSAAHRWFRCWQRSGLWDQIAARLAPSYPALS
jgi:transposase